MHGWVASYQITEYQIDLDIIEIIEFCLKISDLWQNLHAHTTHWSQSLAIVSSIVQLFDFLMIDILCITATFGHSFHILTFDFLLKPPLCSARIHGLADSNEPATNGCLVKIILTRMHSSMIHITHFSCCLGGFCLGDVCLGGCLPRGCLPRGCLPGGVHPHCMLGYTPPPVNRMTDRRKNITLPQNSFAGGDKQLQTLCAFLSDALHKI